MIILPEIELLISVEEPEHSRLVEHIRVKFTPVEIDFRAGGALCSSKFMYRYEMYTFHTILKIESNPEKGIIWLAENELNLLKTATTDNADIRDFFNSLINEVFGWKPFKEEKKDESQNKKET